ncbi:Bestrophin, RFP-TM, chloride channel-domain-containing protein [Leucosporidium creatinivorum]|uniref:Bestrophin, RFP-TM, chloride channel-domain-containing protein n=1 Tax=Leucosporidium creatinivorum TaxID=106004 RepID=A0A1Y2G183_9BASI|nr:Bestrophin, RFP-TM, chloride channel-domain-containing protein [Leucosporidium creatinivorum]
MSSRSSNPPLLASRSSSIFVHSPSTAADYHATLWPAPGTVFWRIWPAVLFHTVFCAFIVTATELTAYNLAVPGVMLTVLGLVVGFGISWRASQGYANFQEGRQQWAQVVRISRTLARLCWKHVPEGASSVCNEQEKERELIREEKKKFIGLIEAFAVATKHALRGEEKGVFYDDLYHLVSWLPRFHSRSPTPSAIHIPTSYTSSISTSPVDNQFDTNGLRPSISVNGGSSSQASSRAPSHTPAAADPVYGTFASSDNSATHRIDIHTPTQPLLPSQDDTPPRRAVIWDLLLPYAIFKGLLRSQKDPPTHESSTLHRNRTISRPHRRPTPPAPKAKVPGPHVLGGVRKFSPELIHEKVENLPLVILGEMSLYVGVLERRRVSGAVTGGLYAGLQGLEEALTGMEKILTSPLPVVYSVHLRQTVWIYLLALPSQLVEQAGFFTIPVVLIASFLFLGFLAAGEELSSPFGYDENDINIDLLITKVIHADLVEIMAREAPREGKWYVSGCAESAEGASKEGDGEGRGGG